MEVRVFSSAPLVNTKAATQVAAFFVLVTINKQTIYRNCPFFGQTEAAATAHHPVPIRKKTILRSKAPAPQPSWTVQIPLQHIQQPHFP